MSDELIELPEGWQWVEIRDILSITSGEAFKKKDYSSFGTKLLQIANVSFGKITWEQQNFLPQDIALQYPEIFLKQNDIVMALNRPILDGLLKIACLKEEDLPAILYQRVACFRLFVEEMKEYFFHYSMSPSFIQMICDNLQGSDQPYINTSVLPGLKVPLAPIAEQKRIVAKIEELRSKTQKAREALEAVPQMCDRFRQSVLAAAFRGDLTADWREENPDVEPAQALLEKTRVQCKQQIKKFAKDSTPLTVEELPTIPASWQWIRFKEIMTAFRSGSTEVPQDNFTKYPILRSSSVRPGKVDLQDIRFLTQQQSTNADNYLCEGDLLFTRLSGSLDYVANCAVVRNLSGAEIQYPDRLFCAKLVDQAYVDYSELCFVNPVVREVITRRAKSSAGHQRVSMSDIAEAPIPFAPLEEQKEIVKQIHSLFGVIDRIQQQYEDAKARLEKLDRAILAKAFRGELVPQDPDDEPASVLLDRIRQERAKVSDRKSTKRKR
ncbi:restriction modification system DNA specificity domain-containing protein [Leptolyngbya boryana NIES-2135]|jgi:type I restriction enzyme S subunit|uniref:Restriction modification system DNA specificity domain-containing protein n=1 Tax=Leptolyngbya boryana NIES-2135 TaxID=1973484 RepID=A0A1Z4JGB6_LEPBY|nr:MULTISPECIES: restriction endonuclease subunit S [Leptolyngbya]BAY55802.1 restriction modification system DNA specificity domain-containing protein [Leptolyngbya boryana NIES-2135]MBD2368893.1 restriction endonuclease subunit S [Leptolyngbya sp. FACHB-161]MBD2375239.1 restriction endonuclease subunit S [Leptolyngbya sp. FACHB-238]MBD2399657.1 restriction endonuclease subunit S [Leptolyngbya sp. FACHB-239]MBD2405863.1 restriction endonuclease subunit S [Leptolyngbya sp. FACHB-402]